MCMIDEILLQVHQGPRNIFMTTFNGICYGTTSKNNIVDFRKICSSLKLSKVDLEIHMAGTVTLFGSENLHTTIKLDRRLSCLTLYATVKSGGKACLQS